MVHILAAVNGKSLGEDIARKLQRDDRRVTLAFDGDTALSCAAKEDPDAVILDTVVSGTLGL